MVGGGTAGHILPLLLLAARLQRKGAEIFLLHSGSQQDRALLHHHPYARGLNLRSLIVPAGKWRRYFDFRNLWDLLVNLVGFFYVFFLLLTLRPQVVLSKGGYVGFLPGLAAYCLRIPLFLHESDSVLGLSNRLLAYLAQKIFVAFPLETYRSLPPAIRRKLISTGLPVSDVLRQATPLRRYAATPTILITGGSQGARQINDLISGILPQLLNKYRLFHLSGKLDYPELKERREKLPAVLRDNYELHSFKPLQTLLRQADLVISRAGATTIFELAAAGKPVILIPLPGSANRHQEKNAHQLAKRGAALVLTGRKLSPPALLDTIRRLMTREAARTKLAQKIKALDNPQAIETISRFLLN